MLVYIRVSVVLIYSLSRKEREKLDISLDRHSFSFGSLGNLVRLYFFKLYSNQVGMSARFDPHTLGLGV